MEKSHGDVQDLLSKIDRYNAWYEREVIEASADQDNRVPLDPVPKIEHLIALKFRADMPHPVTVIRDRSGIPHVYGASERFDPGGR